MPLVIIVLVIVLIAISTKESYQSNANNRVVVSGKLRKTNARLEQMLVGKYLLEGWNFDEAYEKAIVELTARGYVACMSPDDYRKDVIVPDYIGDHVAVRCETSRACSGYKRWLKDQNSEAVKLRLKILEKQWKITHPGEPTPEFPDSIIYAKFPTSECELSEDYKRSMKLTGIYPVGSIIYIPNDGEYKVLEIIDGDERILERPACFIFSLYKVKSLRTGEITQKSTSIKGIRKL